MGIRTKTMDFYTSLFFRRSLMEDETGYKVSNEVGLIWPALSYPRTNLYGHSKFDQYLAVSNCI